MYYNQSPYQYTGQQIVKVNGENGARAYQLPPNGSILLLDETAPIVWLKQTDGAGYPTVTPYKIEPYVKPEEPSLEALIKRIEKLEGMINVQSNITET